MDKAGTALLQEGRNCWRIEAADRFAFIVDGDGYFKAVRAAMLKARHSITMIGWDFDARIKLDREPDEGPERLGDFILWLADNSPSLEIRLLRWDTGALKATISRNMLQTIFRWKMHPRITLRFDGVHPPASSHHQKIVVIDDCVAFCGGIDMTTERWDTREHLDEDPNRVDPRGRQLKPWHDATSAFDGQAARAMGDLARARWKAATDEELTPCSDQHDCWPDELEPTFRDIRLGIARSIPKMEGVEPIHEIEQLYLDLIARAKKFIYAESQYFASRKIAHAVAERLAEENGPEIVIVNPHSAEGWLEPIAMDTARARLVEALRKVDHKGRLRVYHPETEGGNEIYVHAKVTVIDDEILRVGSSNFNNRSLRLDTECDVLLSTDEEGCGHIGDEIAVLRHDLLAEHLGVSTKVVAEKERETGSMIAAIEALRGQGRSLVPYEVPELSGIEEWLADNEILDPNGPDEIFEATSKRGLFKGWKNLKQRFGGRSRGANPD